MLGGVETKSRMPNRRTEKRAHHFIHVRIGSQCHLARTRPADQRSKPGMPPKRRKFESTFPAVSLRHLCVRVRGCVRVRAVLQARIKKIMQLDDDVGRVASSVPVVICIPHPSHFPPPPSLTYGGAGVHYVWGAQGKYMGYDRCSFSVRVFSLD